MTAIPTYPSFETDIDAASKPELWNQWIDGLEALMDAMGGVDHSRKWSMLRHYGGAELRNVEKQLDYDKTTPYGVGDAAVVDHYRRLKEALTTHFAPTQNITYANFVFGEMVQEDGEDIDCYVTRLKKQAKICGFCDKACSDRSIRNRIAAGCQSQRIRRKALEADVTLEKLIQMARSEESAQAKAKVMEKAATQEETREVFSATKKPGKYSGRSAFKPREVSKPGGTSFSPSPNPPMSPKKCFYCGGRYPHLPEKPCPAKNRNCMKCGKLGHFAICCHSDKPGGRSALAAVREDSSSEEEDYVNVGRFVSINQTDTVLNKRRNAVMVDIGTNGEVIEYNADTGADVTLIDYSTFVKMNPRPHLQLSNVKFKPYLAEKSMKVRGCFWATLEWNGKKQREEIFVSPGNGHGMNLLSRDASENLGIVTINIPRIINSVVNCPPEGMKDHVLMEKYPRVFSGIGRHKDLELKLTLREGAKAAVSPPSRIPFHLQSKVKEEIDRLLEAGVFEQVPVDDSTQFVSRLVPVPKKVEGSNEVGVRLTMDYRELNKNLEAVHHAVPNFEELRHDLNGARRFFRLDMNHAFFQYPLDEDSRRLTTFTTPWGLYRSTSLVQGAKPSAAMCHEALRRDLSGIQNVLNIADDIVGWGCGETEEEIQRDHDRALEATLAMFEKNSLTLNRDKCVFNASKIKFFGYIFTKDGMFADPEKVEAAVEAAEPTSKDEVQSWYGMITFNGQFIPGLATLTAPIRKLLRKGVPFVWGEKQRNSFRAVTELLADRAMLNHFDTRRKSGLITDASPDGLQATLIQMDEQGVWQPCQFASRALTDTEKGYSQLEKEAIAMHFGCIRFRMFLQGCEFVHFIDPEPLKAMMEKSKKEAPARIDKVRLKLQGFSSKLQLVKGKHNPADYGSRHPLPLNRCSRSERKEFAEIENHLFAVVKMLPDAITFAMVQKATNEDEVLMKIMEVLKSSERSFPLQADSSLLPFRNIWASLSVLDGVLLRGDRIVLPNSLRVSAVKIAHEGHMGVEKSKQFLRGAVWFPSMDQMVEDLVRKCLPCAAVTPAGTKEPLVMSTLPTEPWAEVAVDLFGPLPTGEKLLVVKDLRSKWPEVVILSRRQGSDATSVTSALRKVFATHGVPDVVRSDNGPPFNSRAYQEFARQVGFVIQRVTPLWPQANGQCENFMKSIGKVVRTATVEGVDWRYALDDFLLVYRGTKHPSTGASPAELMFPGRQFKTRLPLMRKKADGVDQARIVNDGVMGKAKERADLRNRAKMSEFAIGDHVLVRQPKRNKLTTYYDPEPYIIIGITGSMITASRHDHRIVRNCSFFRQAPVTKAMFQRQDRQRRGLDRRVAEPRQQEVLPTFDLRETEPRVEPVVEPAAEDVLGQAEERAEGGELPQGEREERRVVRPRFPMPVGPIANQPFRLPEEYRKQQEETLMAGHGYSLRKKDKN